MDWNSHCMWAVLSVRLCDSFIDYECTIVSCSLTFVPQTWACMLYGDWTLKWLGWSRKHESTWTLKHSSMVKWVADARWLYLHMRSDSTSQQSHPQRSHCMRSDLHEITAGGRPLLPEPWVEAPADTWASGGTCGQHAQQIHKGGQNWAVELSRPFCLKPSRRIEITRRM